MGERRDENGDVDSVEYVTAIPPIGGSLFTEFGFHSLCNSIRRISRDIPVCLCVPFNLLNRRRSNGDKVATPVFASVTPFSLYQQPEASN